MVVLLDSLTRLGRAYNLAAPANGRVLGGLVDASAVHPTKEFFGAARKIEDAGSLTILATVSVGTGSATDEFFLEELAGTANLELRAQRRPCGEGHRARRRRRRPRAPATRRSCSRPPRAPSSATCASSSPPPTPRQAVDQGLRLAAEPRLPAAGIAGLAPLLRAVAHLCVGSGSRHQRSTRDDPEQLERTP